MTRLGFKALYGSGWQLAAVKNMYPDIGVYHSHQMVDLAEPWKGIEGARHTHYYDTEGKELLNVPPMFMDMEAGFGGPTQTFSLATELVRARVGGVHLENQDPADRTCGHIVNVGKAKRDKVLVPRATWLAKLKAIRAAAEAMGEDLVIIARTDSVDGALPGQSSGGVKMAVEDAWEASELGCDVIWAEVNNVDLSSRGPSPRGVQALPQPDARLQPLPLALLGEGQEGRHPHHQPAARRPGLHPPVLDALQLPHRRHGARQGPAQVRRQGPRRPRRPADRGR
ncbi:MAG: isocitrate lyase/phosphoenolpyruvate mutase family protein [Gemmatimonadetes bacterium]|nr:isocitrate lyase/phosphoenolpyruvate mutase family protein [Gemmatimonadota bacterium]